MFPIHLSIHWFSIMLDENVLPDQREGVVNLDGKGAKVLLD